MPFALTPRSRSTSLEYTRVVRLHQRANLDPMLPVGFQCLSVAFGVIRHHRVHDIYGRWVYERLRLLTSSPIPRGRGRYTIARFGPS